MLNNGFAKKGRVFLVGAGPGAPGLLTCKGRKLLEEAEVVVYDRLIENALLNYVKEDCELIYAGKKPGDHRLTQQEINETLAEKAQQGKLVVRLKGGDPFLFGRGGEEAEHLNKADIAFEIVPGITSALSVPAYAGIPATSRGVSASAAIITGHEDPNKESSSHDWKSLARGPETLIFLMGVNNLPEISEKLLSYGRDAETPVAMIEKGSRPEQREVYTTLKKASQEVVEKNIKPPAIIIMGEVVKLGKSLKWSIPGALAGLRVINTRPKDQARSFTKMLQQAGAIVREAPAIKITKPESYTALDQALEDIATYNWLIFTSTNGVEKFFQRFQTNGQDIREMAGTKLAAIGNKTAAALEEKGLKVDFVPEEYVAESLLAGLKKRINSPAETKILLPRTPKARSLLQDELSRLGCQVDEVPAYNTAAGQLPEDVLRDLENNIYDVITFTSSSTVESFLAGIDNKELLANLNIATIGPITSRTVRQQGLKVSIEAESYNIPGLYQAIIDYYQVGE